MATDVACRAEDKVRLAAAVKPSRVVDYFRDFDRLRSGRVTRNQFERCLSQHFAVNLSTEEFRALCDKYGAQRPAGDKVDYERFADCVKGPQDTAAVEPMYPPATALHTAAERSLFQENVELWQILDKCQNFFQQHGVNIKAAFQETHFDRHNMGYVTDPQFRRAFPGPRNMVSEEEITLLINHYRNPATMLVNYMQFHRDVASMQEARRVPEAILPPHQSQPSTLSKEARVAGVLTRVRDAVYHYRIRTTEFFTDYDRHNHGVVTDNQFVCALMLCCGKQAALTRSDTQVLVEHFRKDKLHVDYRQFCHLMEHAYTVPDLDKKPTQAVYRPSDGELSKTFNTLTNQEEETIEELLGKLSERVDERQLMTYPLFKDFDWSGAYTRGITAAQFRRMLDYVSLQVSEPEFKLLCRKYRNDRRGDINYTAFLQAIDKGYVAHAGIDRRIDLKPPVHTKPHWSSLGTPFKAHPGHGYEELMARLREHVVRNQIRVREYFQDFDSHRSGSITAEQFKRGLDAVGLKPLLASDADLLCEVYADNSRSDRKCVLWTKFELDIDQVFTRRDLQQCPTATLPSLDEFLLPKEGSLEATRVPIGKRAQSAILEANDNFGERKTEDDWIYLAKNALRRMRDQVSNRKLLPRPVFQDFDKNNDGHVTERQFRQGLSNLVLDYTDEELHALEVKYGNNAGVNYIRFVEDIDPPHKEVLKYPQRLADLKSTRDWKLKLKSMKPEAAAVMEKMHIKIMKERMRPSEFMQDYDKFRTGRVPRSVMPRPLDLCNFGLTQGEVDAVLDHYAAKDDPTKVDWMQLCEDLERAFTAPRLEKTILQPEDPMVLPDELAERQLNSDDKENLDDALKELSEQVMLRHIDLFPPFEDFDRLKMGYVTQSQFRRALEQLSLTGCIAPEWWAPLHKKFNVNVGGRHDINYNAFCHTLIRTADHIHRP